MDEMDETNQNAETGDKSNDSLEENEEGDYSALGICLGICLGMTVGRLFF